MARILGVTIRGVLLCCGLLVMRGGVHAVSTEFNCHRDGTGCKAGGTCTTEGVCVCPGTLDGFDCSHDTSTNAADQRSCGCNEAAQGFFCKTNGDCFCPPTYYGNKCQFRTFQIICSLPGKIITNINVPGATTAQVFLKDKRGSCDYSTTVPADSPAGWEGTFLETEIGSSSNCAAETVTDQNGFAGYCVTSVLQYNSLYVTGLDAAIRLCCMNYVVSKEVGQIQPVDRSTTTTTQATQRASIIHASSAMPIVLAVMAWSVYALLR